MRFFFVVEEEKRASGVKNDNLTKCPDRTVYTFLISFDLLSFSQSRGRTSGNIGISLCPFCLVFQFRFNWWDKYRVSCKCYEILSNNPSVKVGGKKHRIYLFNARSSVLYDQRKKNQGWFKNPSSVARCDGSRTSSGRTRIPVVYWYVARVDLSLGCLRVLRSGRLNTSCPRAQWPD